MINSNQVPAWNYYAEFQLLVNRKRSAVHLPVLNGLMGQLQQRFLDFERNRRRLEAVPQVARTADECAALKSCYQDGESLQRDLLELLGYADDEQPAISCPYCQLFPVGAWDHFLPSSLFPDFYVHPLNLVRTCKHCNEIKGARYVVPLRETIHPYFEPLHVRYLRCTISYRTDFAVSYEIDPDRNHPDYDPYTHDVVDRHFEAYDLGKKFTAETSRKIGDFKTNMAKILEERPVTMNDIDREIRQETRKLVNQGELTNSWQLSYWEAMRNLPRLDNIVNNDPIVLVLAAAHP